MGARKPPAAAALAAMGCGTTKFETPSGRKNGFELIELRIGHIRDAHEVRRRNGDKSTRARAVSSVNEQRDARVRSNNAAKSCRAASATAIA